jgi:hypothetical protein
MARRDGAAVMLASVEPETVEAYLRTGKNQHTRMNKCIALKSFARYLAKKQIWYAGTKEQHSSVLQEVQQPKPSPSGMPGYSDDELHVSEQGSPADAQAQHRYG